MVPDEARASKERGLLAFVALAAMVLSLFALGCGLEKRKFPEDVFDQVDALSGGSDVMCARRQGETWCWGGDELVAKGTGRAQRVAIPHLAAVADGAVQTCVLFDDRTVACTEAAHPMFEPTWPAGPAIGPQRRLWRVPGLERIEQIGVGRLIDCARRADGVVLCWGNNASGTVADVKGLPAIAHLAVGDTSALAIGTDGSAWVIGGEGSPPPWRVPDVDDAVEAASGTTFHCLRHRPGTVSCFRNEPAGRGSKVRALGAIEDVANATRIAAGSDLACAITPLGVSCWGDDRAFLDALATGAAERAPAGAWLAPSHVFGDRFSSLVVGAHRVCGLEDRGHVYCYGDDAARGDPRGEVRGYYGSWIRTGTRADAEQRRAALGGNILTALACLVAAFVARRVLVRASWPGAPVTAGAGYRASALPTTGAPPPPVVGTALYLGLMAIGADAGVLVAAVFARRDFLFMVFVAVAIVLGLLVVAARLLVRGARGSVAALDAWVIVGVFGFVGHASLLFAQLGADGDAMFTPAVVVVSMLGLLGSLVVVRAGRTRALTGTAGC